MAARKTPVESLAKRVRRLREEKTGLGQKAFWEEYGVAVGNIECGRRVNLEIGTAERLAKAFGISVADLLADLEVHEKSREAKRLRKLDLAAAADPGWRANLEEAIAILHDWPGFSSAIADEMRAEAASMARQRAVSEWASLGKSLVAKSRGKASRPVSTDEFDAFPSKPRRKKKNSRR